MRALALSIAIATHAHAESTDIIRRPLTLPRHQLHARLALEYTLEHRMVGTSLSVAPDAWFGVTDKLTVGVIHSSQSVDRIASRSTVCVRETLFGCDRAYQGSGLDALYNLGAVAARMRFLVRDTDPWKPAVTLGTLARWTRSRFSIATDPYLRIGLANTDQGNRAAIVLPVYFGVQPTCRWLVEIHTGADGDLAVIEDGWHMPLGLIVRARATSRIDIAIEAGFPQIYGPQTDVRQREVMLSLEYRGPLR